jgi:hypothetical protein
VGGRAWVFTSCHRAKRGPGTRIQDLGEITGSGFNIDELGVGRERRKVAKSVFDRDTEFRGVVYISPSDKGAKGGLGALAVLASN